MDLTEQSITSGFRSQTDATCAAVTACRLMGFPVCLCVKFSLTRRLNTSAASLQISVSARSRLGGLSERGHLIRRIKQIPGIDSVTLTTNGTLALQHLEELKAIGIDGINFSLDTLKPAVFHQITGESGLEDVLAAINRAVSLQIPNIKINCVPVRDFNLSEIPDIAALAEDYPIHVRFIEMMPIGLGKDFQMISEAEICHLLKDTYGSLEPIDGIFGNGPAHYYHIPGFKGHIGFISAMSHMFCDGCNRIRLTTDGQLKTCLFYENGIDLKSLIRNNCSDEELRQQVCLALQNKPQHHEISSLPPELRGMSQIGG
ncbi:MAG: GTP 3',8-cyclase MoaA [Coprococcus sp.]